MSEKPEDKNLRIKGIKIKNFKKIDTIKVEFDGGHTRIIGLNGHGKTSIIDAIRACFVGISQKSSKGEILGERFRFIGSKGAAAELEVQLEDTKGNFICTVSNHLTAGGNGINIITKDGRTLSKQWARDLFNVIFRSADNFLKLSPKEQALALGIDTDIFDERIVQKKDVAKLVRRDLKAVGEPKELEQVERVDTYALRQEEKRIEAHNKEQEERQEELDTQQEHITECESNVASKERELQEAKDQLKGSKEFLKGMPQPTDQLATTHIADQLENADETNRAAEAYGHNESKRRERDKLVKELDATQKEINEVVEQRTTYIKEFNFAVDGLSVSDDGGLMLDGRRLDTYSTAERVNIVNQLNKSLDPQLLSVYIDDFQNLDAPHQEQIINDLVGSGKQVITFEVGDTAKGKGSILLRDCAVVE